MRASGIISVEDSEQALEVAADASGVDAFMLRHSTGVLIPLASRIEFYNLTTNNPKNPKYIEHYPRFTVRLMTRQLDGTYFEDVECRKRVAALDDSVSRRYLPLYTIQSIVTEVGGAWCAMQSSCVETTELFDFVRKRRLDDPTVGTVSYTNRERDGYRLITVEKLNLAGVSVRTIDCS